MSDNQEYGIASQELRQFIEQIEGIRSEIDDRKEAEKEIFAEAKARGYSTPTIRKVIALRKRNPDDVAEDNAIFEMYAAALGKAEAKWRGARV